MPIQSTRKGVSSVLKIMLKLVGVSAEVVLEANRKQSDYESPNNPFEEDEVNGHKGVDIDRILHDEEIDDAEVFDD